VHGDSVETPAGGSVESTVNCDTGEILTGGGFEAHSTLIRIYKSFPVDDNTWIVSGFNEGSAAATLAPFAICVDPSLP
jgi:hypothetical protein